MVRYLDDWRSSDLVLQMLNLTQSNAKPRQFSLPNLCRNKYNLRRIVQNSSKKQDRSLTLGISIFSGSKLVMGDIST